MLSLLSDSMAFCALVGSAHLATEATGSHNRRLLDMRMRRGRAPRPVDAQRSRAPRPADPPRSRDEAPRTRSERPADPPRTRSERPADPPRVRPSGFMPMADGPSAAGGYGGAVADGMPMAMAI